MTTRRGTKSGAGGVLVTSLETIFRQFANEVHWQVLASIAREPKSVEDIAAELPVLAPCVSKSLSLMRDHGLVEYDRWKTRRIYRLNAQFVTVAQENELRITFVTQDGATIHVARRDLSGDRSSAPVP